MIDEVRTMLRERSPRPFLVGGRWTLGRDATTGDVIDPSTGERIATVALGVPDDVDDAVRVARDASRGWAATPGADRATVLRRLADAVAAASGEIGVLESLNVGKPVADAVGFDIPFACEAFRYFASVAEEGPRRDELALDGLDASMRYVPRGVCGFIVPWNAPVLLTSWGIAPALAAGNAVVVKPAEATPLSTLRIAEIALEVGPPARRAQRRSGARAGRRCRPRRQYWDRHDLLHGSPRVGREIAQTAAARLVPSKLELGGKGAAVVFDDVDVTATARKLAVAVTLNARQVCCTATRWLVHEAVVDRLVAAASKALTELRIGPGEDERTQLGPVASRVQLDRVLGYQEKGLAEGARFLLEGGRAEVPGHDGGFYVRPAIMTGPPDNVCAQEEIFGPVAYVIPFRTEDEAVAIVNASDYGLANSVWSADLERARRVAERLVSGSTWINAHNVFAYGLPYGGVNRNG